MRVSRQGGGVRGAQGYLVSLWPVYTHLLPTLPIPAQAPCLFLEACPVDLHPGNRTSDQIPLAAGLGEWPENTVLSLLF